MRAVSDVTERVMIRGPQRCRVNNGVRPTGFGGKYNFIYKESSGKLARGS